MRVACPSCSAAYEVPDRLVATFPRRLRCARCAREWLAEAPEGATRPPAGPAPAPEREPMVPPPPEPPPSLLDTSAMREARVVTSEDFSEEDEAAQARKARRARWWLAAAWVASLALVAALAWELYAHRVGIVAAWPPAGRLYDAIGLPPRA
jgi:predicted Zn finger-like uncharacterized protein